MSQEEKTTSKPNPSRNDKRRGESPFWKQPKFIVPVLIALFGCIPPVIVALLNPEIFSLVLDKFFNDPTATPFIATMEVSPSPTNLSPSETSTPEFSCTLQHTCTAGQDWGHDCIAGYDWAVYSSSDFPTVQKDGMECFSQPILDVFYTKNKGLYIFAQHKNLIASKDYGLFTALPQSGNFSLTLDLDKLDNGQVWVGVFERPDPNSKGVLLVAPPGDVKSQAFALKTMPDQKRIQVSKIYENQSGIYTLGFTLEYGSVIANVEGTSLTPIPFPPSARWLFIGYRVKVDDPDIDGSADIQALITNLKIGQ